MDSAVDIGIGKLYKILKSAQGRERVFLYVFFTACLLLPASLPASLPSSLRASLQCCSHPWPQSEALPLLPGSPSTASMHPLWAGWPRPELASGRYC